MNFSRRSFLRYCGLCTASIGLDPLDLGLLRTALANPDGPVVIWLHGSSCTGCSVSLLNRISDRVGEPPTVTEVLTDAVNLVYHGTLMAAAGEGAAAILEAARARGNYVLVTEGGVPTAFNGQCCVVYQRDGRDVSYQEAVTELSESALAVLCVGTCASFGGIPRSMSNPTGVIGVPDLIGRPTINLSGCPAHPDWVVWTLVQILLGHPIELDADQRPTALYATDLQDLPAPPLLHDKCPRNGHPLASGFDDTAGEKCLIQLGCRGPDTKARCHNCWNGVAGQGHWCIGVNAPCHGCTERTFPGPESFYAPYSTL